MRGRLIDLVTGLNNLQRITIEVPGDFRDEYNRLKDDQVNIEIKKYRKGRSLDANSYCWILIDKIAEALSIDKETVYKDAIRSIGGVSETVCVQEKAADSLCRAWGHNGIGWQAERFESKINGCVNIILYYGSSVYDTKQMSALIEHLVFEAKELGIETDTPEAIAKYADEWGRCG